MHRKRQITSESESGRVFKQTAYLFGLDCPGQDSILHMRGMASHHEMGIVDAQGKGDGRLDLSEANTELAFLMLETGLKFYSESSQLYAY